MDLHSVFWVFIFLFLFIFLRVYRVISLTRNVLNREHVNENSFQNYAKFYGEVIPSEKDFDQKLNCIYNLIVNQHVDDIQKIMELSQCSLTETVLKIRYLKNKKMIGDYYIDTVHMKLVPCSLEDEKLLEKYKPYIYAMHIQIDEMVPLIQNPERLNVSSLRNQIFRELTYLDKKGLLNGLKIDDIDGTILYYSIEKRKVFSDHETIHCPNCGALNDVDVMGKCRCGYCGTILVGKNYQDSVHY